MLFRDGGADRPCRFVTYNHIDPPRAMASVSSDEILNWDMKVIVKQCTSEHFEGWVRLRQCLWPDDTLDEHRRYAESILNRPSGAVVYLACEDREVIAFGEATLRRDYVNGCRSSPIGFLEGLYVEPHYRRRGLARLLSSALEDWAKGIGCTEFASDVLLSNETGQKVHEALGFNESDRVVFYVKRLSSLRQQPAR